MAAIVLNCFFFSKIERGLNFKENYFLWLGHITAELIRIFKGLNEKKSVVGTISLHNYTSWY